MEQLEMEHGTMAHSKTIWEWNTIVDNAVFCISTVEQNVDRNRKTRGSTIRVFSTGNIWKMKQLEIDKN